MLNVTFSKSCIKQYRNEQNIWRSTSSEFIGSKGEREEEKEEEIMGRQLWEGRQAQKSDKKEKKKRKR